MEDLFNKIVEHLNSKTDYFKIFADNSSRMEGWVEGEILWLLAKNEIEIISTKKGGTKRPDILLKLSNKELSLELKAIMIEENRRTLKFYFERNNQLKKDFNKLTEETEKEPWLIIVAYPVKNQEWNKYIRKAQNEFKIRMIKSQHLSSHQVIVSLWTRDTDSNAHQNH